MSSLAVVLGGVAGGLAGRATGGGGAGPVAGVSTATPAPTPFAPQGGAGMTRAAERALASVVTVIAELPPSVDSSGVRSEQTNAGTGIVLGEDGLILTNFHVISGAARVRVILPTGESRDATFVADDSPFQDMALLSIPAGGLKAAVLGSSAALRSGEPVIAVASGVNSVQNQVKGGVVSATKVELVRPGLILNGMIQTDAAVNHGDSGGALVNANGEVVGVLTTIVRQQPSGDIVEGVALCHAIDDLKPIIDAVRSSGSNPRPRLGIERFGTQHRLLSAAEAAQLRLQPSGGIVVTRVDPGSPAEAAGIRTGDIVVGVGNSRLSQAEPFVNLLAAVGSNEVRLAVVRDGVARPLAVTPRPVRRS
ncbi:MAG: PDZ domain-containing protein [Dehalococcoidia bacterium]|nr:MAG: PDZ domain-containing protein [Dehalococcoidia bacterium]